MSSMSSATSETQAAALRPWHFFLVLGLLGATAAVLVARQNTPSNLILVSLAVLTAAFAGHLFHRTLWPLVSDDAALSAPVAEGRARAGLEREKQLVLRSLKELEFDRAMEKIAESDYEEMVTRLRARAIGLMQQLDEPAPGFRDRIEEELKARLAKKGVQPGAAAAAAGACGACGTRNDADARFCKSCGAKLG
jgi:hypothetical protein